jgi:hypothetical protein
MASHTYLRRSIPEIADDPFCFAALCRLLPVLLCLLLHLALQVLPLLLLQVVDYFALPLLREALIQTLSP